jgi:hypothetical protein
MPFSSLLMMLILGASLQSRSSLADSPAEWIVGFDKQWSTAVGLINPSPEVLKIIEDTKGGLFADPDVADVWQERVLSFMNDGLMSGRGAKVFLAPGMGLPANQMSAEQFGQVTEMLAELKGLPGERILAFIADDDDQWELWTTECIYANNYGGGMARVEKTSYGWNYPYLMFDGERKHLEVLRFWDLALSNDTAEDVKGPKGTEIFINPVKLFLERSIEPKATTTIFVTQAKRSDEILFIQNECRRFLTARIAKALQKDQAILTNHSGFRSAKWGASFDETSRSLTPFLLHDHSESFISSRLTPDIAMFYGKHLAGTEAVAKTIKADLWPAILKLQVQQITENNAERIGISIATRPFTGRFDMLDEFIATTGIPVAPDFDYWSYATPIGRYTAWFIDNQFYAMVIEPSTDTAKHTDAVLADLTNRYGEFIDCPGKFGKSHFIHEDADGGTLVMYEPSGGTRELKRIYHYSLKLRPLVNAKLAAVSAEADKKAAEEKAATAKKAAQF